MRESGSCLNRRIIYLRDIERLVLSGMVEELKNPPLIETYVRNYNRERERLARNASAERLRLEVRPDRIEGERQRNIDLVIKCVIFRRGCQATDRRAEAGAVAGRGGTGCPR